MSDAAAESAVAFGFWDALGASPVSWRWERARWLPTRWPPGPSFLRSERIHSLKFRLLQGRRSGLCSSPCLQSVFCCCHFAFSTPPRLLSPTKWKNIPNCTKIFFRGNAVKTRRNLPISLHLSPSLDSECFDLYTFCRYCGGTGTGQCPISSPGAQRQKESIL